MSIPSWYQSYSKMRQAPKFDIVKDKILSQIATTREIVEAQKVANALNQIHQGLQNFPENYNLSELLAQKMEKKNILEGLTFDSTSLNVKSLIRENLVKELKNVENSIKSYEITSKEYTELVEKKSMMIKNIQSIDGRLNKIRGDILEGFLQYAMSYATQEIEINAEKILTEMTQELIASTNLKTIGSFSQPSGGKMSVLSQGKIDVSIKGPNEEIWNISAKNYASQKDLHLLAGANGAAIIGVWETYDSNLANYYRNAISVRAPGDKNINNLIEESKMIIGIQALTSQKTSGFVNYLIVYVRSRKNPFVVIPLKQYLNKIMEKPNKDFPFKLEWRAKFGDEDRTTLPILRGEEKRSPKIAERALNTFQIKSVMLKSAYFTKKKLESFSK